MCGRRTVPVFVFWTAHQDRTVAVDGDEVKRIAKLAALALSQEEIDRYQGDLDAILAYIAQIQKADVGDASMELDPDRTDTVLRDDVVRPGLTREQALANAPDSDGENFRVPPAIPGGG
jgi:aspartyl-tRNA(Asn)/glutamyl-tRNA(Gln) amidotransferase subunit C